MGEVQERVGAEAVACWAVGGRVEGRRPGGAEGLRVREARGAREGDAEEEVLGEFGEGAAGYGAVFGVSGGLGVGESVG